MARQIISDEKVFHIWEKNCDCDFDDVDGEEEVTPDFYEENGEPCCQYCGTVFSYIRTEIVLDEENDTCACGHVFTASDIDGGRCFGCGTMILPKRNG